MKTVEIVIINRKGLGSSNLTVDFTNFIDLRKTVDELLENLEFRKVLVELTPSWEPTSDEQQEFENIENLD